jgi:hypothetical protein
MKRMIADFCSQRLDFYTGMIVGTLCGVILSWLLLMALAIAVVILA